MKSSDLFTALSIDQLQFDERSKGMLYIYRDKLEQSILSKHRYDDLMSSCRIVIE
jgi:hypothetical protein